MPQTLSYSVLQSELQFDTVRALEDFLIESVYAELIEARLDQRNGSVEIQSVIGRDVRDDEVSGLLNTMLAWYANTKMVTKAMEDSVSNASSEFAVASDHKAHLRRRLEERKIYIRQRLAELAMHPTAMDLGEYALARARARVRACACVHVRALTLCV